jgi:hypothetical protein
MWAVMNAILYLPRDSFPPHSTGPEHLPQISGRWVWEAIWTEIAHDASRTLWVGRQHNRRRVRQPVAEVGRGSGKTTQGVRYGQKVMGQKVHALVDAEGLLSSGAKCNPCVTEGARYSSSPSRLCPLEIEQKAGVRNGKPDFSLRNQCCRRGCTSRRNPPLPLRVVIHQPPYNGATLVIDKIRSQ